MADSTPFSPYFSFKLGRFPFALCAIVVQTTFIILFAQFVDYGWEANGTDARHGFDPIYGGVKPKNNSVYSNYGMFADVHVMVFFGIGFLFTFLKKYSYSGVGLNILLGSFIVQWAILCQGFFALDNGRIKISLESLLTADVAAATGLISWGALLGKTSPLQLLVLGLIEVPLYSLNEWMALHVYQAIDPGATMLCHIFACYFGLAVSLMIYRKDHLQSPKEAAEYHSDVFSILGTVILWVFWPSFNAALTTGDDRHRAVINTYLSLAACCVMSFAVSSLVTSQNRFNMVHIQNATLAGGVVMGTACTAIMDPYAALIIGGLAAVICVLGFKYVTPILANRCRIHDTCGINNLHGMIGIFGGVVGAIMAALATEEEYGLKLYMMYPAMAPPNSSKEFEVIKAQLSTVESGPGRTAALQASFQLLSIVTTLGISIAGGLFAGLVIRFSVFDPPTDRQMYDDEDYWEVPEDDESEPNNHLHHHHNVPVSSAKMITEDTKV